MHLLQASSSTANPAHRVARQREPSGSAARRTARIASASRPRARRGLTFVEVLFAVIVLGIGFIMIAAIFPVAIQQTQSNVDETVGSTIARGAANALNQINIASLYPIIPPATTPTPPYPYTDSTKYAGARMLSFRDGDASLTLWKAVRGNLILPEDPRYAWVPFYKWAGGSSYMQVVIIGVRVRNKSTYEPFPDLNRGGSSGADATNTTAATLEGRPVSVKITSDGKIPPTFYANFVTTTPTGVTAAINAGTLTIGQNAVAPMTYLVISDDPNSGATNGYVFRIGNQDPNSGQWALMAGNDLSGLDPATISAIPVATATGTTGYPVLGYVVGRALKDPADSTQGFDGAAQDVSMYQTFINTN